MQVTKVILSTPQEPGKVLAYCSIVLDDMLQIHDIRLKANSTGRYLMMPPKRDARGVIQKLQGGLTNRDIVHPVTRELQDIIMSAIEQGYENLKLTGDCVYLPQE